MTKLVEKVIKGIPDIDHILKEAVESLKLHEVSAEGIMSNFEQRIREVESKAFKIYRRYEKEAFEKLNDMWIRQNANWITKILEEKGQEGIADILSGFTSFVRDLEFRAGQMRKARGGKTFERIVKLLLNLAGVPCEEPHRETRKILKRIDLVSPDAETARDTPDKSIFIATKRTLRERWKQVVPEHMKGARLYLVTINDKIPEGKANEIKETGMVVYVRDKLKNQPHLKDKPWVRKLSNLPTDIRNTIPKPRQRRLG